MADLAAAGEDALAAAWAQIAGGLRLEQPTPASWRARRSTTPSRRSASAPARAGRAASAARPERVLHVVTECAAVGGHSRMAWRWIERDAARVPTLALTRQRGPVPDRRAGAVGARGGRVADPEGHDLIARARELAALVDAADLVVLHVHPFEVVAPIALADRAGRPPVLLVNHADHCFWLGPALSPTSW